MTTTHRKRSETSIWFVCGAWAGTATPSHRAADKEEVVTCNVCNIIYDKQQARIGDSTPQPKPKKRRLDAATAAFIIFLAIVLVVAIGALVLFYNADILGQFRWGDLAIWGCVIGAAILLRREIRKWLRKSDSETNK